MKWEYRRLVVPLHIHVKEEEEEKKTWLTALQMDTVTEMVIHPIEDPETDEAWRQANRLGEDGWELLQVVPMIAGHEMMLTEYQSAGGSGTSFLAGYTLIFKRMRDSR